LFHHGCLNPWLINHDTCPMCRAKVNILKVWKREYLGYEQLPGRSSNDQIGDHRLQNRDCRRREMQRMLKERCIQAEKNKRKMSRARQITTSPYRRHS
jgi:hypothetical protein